MHGVSGTPPDSILQMPHPWISIVDGNESSGFFRRWLPGQQTVPTELGVHRVEAYSWGGLTSGPGLRALWLLALPFTLVDLGYWMLPVATTKDPNRAAHGSLGRPRGAATVRPEPDRDRSGRGGARDDGHRGVAMRVAAGVPGPERTRRLARSPGASRTAGRVRCARPGRLRVRAVDHRAQLSHGHERSSADGRGGCAAVAAPQVLRDGVLGRTPPPAARHASQPRFSQLS